MAIHKNYAPLSLGVTEARTELVKAIEEAKNQPIALMHQNKVKAYIVPVALYEEMVEKLKKAEGFDLTKHT